MNDDDYDIDVTESKKHRKLKCTDPDSGETVLEIKVLKSADSKEILDMVEDGAEVMKEKLEDMGLI